MTEDTNLNDILESLDSEPFEFADAELPEEGGLRLPPPQPGGPYTWQIPSVDLGGLWKDEAAVVDGKPVHRPRLYFTDHPLVVVGTPPSVDGAGLAVKLTISTRDTRRKGDLLISDAVYFARALGLRPTSRKDVVAMLSKAGGMFFDSDVVWEASCNPKKDIYLDGALVEGAKGCGQQYSMRPRKYTVKAGPRKGEKVTVAVIPKDGTRWLDSFPCIGERLGANGKPEPCGAEIMVFPRLRNFRVASADIVAAIKAAS